MNVDVISKATGTVSEVSAATVDLTAPSIVRLDVTRADVVGFERQGHDLVIKLVSGEQVRVVGFYPDKATVPNDVVLREPDGTQWLAHTATTPAHFSLIKDLDDLTAVVASGGGSSLALPAILAGVAGAAGLAAVAASGGGGDDKPSQPNPGTGTGVAPDTTPPAAPTATVRGNGTVLSGTGEAGATIQVRDATGAVIGTGVVGADGTYSVTLTAPQIKGDPIVVTQTDPAGNVSGGTTAATPDLTAPAAPSAAVNATGTTITGRGEPGATVTVTNAAGVVIGTAVVAADGTYSVALTVPSVDGTPLSIVQTDAAGNVSTRVSAATPDLTAPSAPTATIAGDGSKVSGRGEPGATVTVRDPAGTVLGTAVVAADGTYSVTLATPRVDGAELSIVQADAAGNVSAPVTAATPDLTAPTAPTATIAGDGTQVTGRGEPGATVTVRDAAGTVLGTAVVAADGTYNVTLATPRVDGTELSIVQADAAGNVSAPVMAATPDLTAPATPTATVAGDGTQVTGHGEPGATVSVTDSTGAIVGTTVVAADGTYTLTLPTPHVDGTNLSIVQTDGAGNVSAPITIATPDLTAPVAPTAAIAGDGSQVTGQGEPGATVTVRDAGGVVIATAVVAADGSYAATLASPQVDGTTLSVVQTDPAGNVSPVVDLGTPDLTAPALPTITIDATGTQVSGTGEPGAQVVITDPAGTTLATVTVAADGSYTAILSAPQVDGEVIGARQTDAAGNASGTASTVAPDFTAPAQPTATINADGTSVAGTGEPGAHIVVADTSGTVIATATVAADGSYSAALTPAQANGEHLTATQVDAAGNAAAPLPLTAPDVTAPLTPVATLDANGTIVTGSGEAGATVTVRDANGLVLGTGTIGAQGNYAVTLAAVQGNSETLSVTQADAAGNVSPATTLVAPDLTAPLAPTGTVGGDGTSISGSGEAGATVTILSPVGAVIATAVVGADGTYTAALTPAQVDGEVLTVRQADAAGNVSPTATATAPDLVFNDAPDAPTATVAANGTAVTGVAVAGAAITLYNADGTIIGTGVAGADGSYSVALTPARIDGETISVTQTDADGVSPPASAVAPDLTAPEAPAATLDPTGAVVTGSGEAGATVTVRAADGTVLGTVTANANGDYAVTLSTVQDAGGTITVTQADAAGNVSPPASLAAPDFTAPDAPVATVAPDGSAVAGTGEAGATVTVRDTAGVVIGSAIVAADGTYAVPLATPQANGETVSVTLTDTAGNVSTPVNAIAPDITAPATPTATVSGDGGLVAGTGEPGAIVTVTAPGGAVIGTATVGAGGSYVVTLATPQANGETLSVTQADAAGNTSAPVSIVAADVTAPAAPTVVVNGDGTAVTGTGEPGATVTITDPAGAAIGTALVDAGGTYTAQLGTAQVNGETLSATQADAAGNVSGIATTIAPDFTAPAPVDAAINGDGTIVSGTGEAGARVDIVDAAGTTIGTAIVAANGSFDVTLTPAQANGEALRVVQTDAAGNVSPALPLTAPDITAPPAPDAALDPSGTIVTGTGEVGATVSVHDAGGADLGTAIVNAQGAYTVVLATPQIDSQSLSVVQSDAAGNTSVATPLTASDLTAPNAPVATVGADGLSVTGTGEAGAAVVVRDPLGAVIGNATVAADGTYTATLSSAQVDGEVLTVRQTDGAGNVSPPATTTAPDLVADTDPAAPTAAVGADGATVVGTAIGGAAITVYDANGAVIATGIANADGSYSVALTPARIDGETIRVTQTETDGGVSPPATAVAPDLTAPIAPTAALDATGHVVTGTGEAGATITVRAADGSPLGTAIVNAGGFYAATLNAAQINGEVLSVTQADGAGNVSQPIALTASDLVAPTTPLATVTADGTAVTGTGEAGTTAIVRDAAGVVIGSALVAADGSFTVPLADAQDHGGTLTVTLTDAAGNVSAPANLAAPDITAPDVPTAVVAADGSAVTGAGEAGATVSVSNANGTVIGTAVVAADGHYSVALTPAQANGEALTVTQADAAGNASGPVGITAPDITVPTAPLVSVVADGTAVTGTGEAGTTATVRDPAGSVIGIAIVAPDGSFTVPLADAQANGGTLTVTLTDAAGNVSAPANALAPDITAPDVPTVTIAADGSVVTGVGEAGATVSVSANGAVIGTAVVAVDGSYSVALTPAQANGEALSVSQADAAGNASGPVAITAPDITAPAAPVVAVSGDGTQVTGTGEPGATISIVGPTGATIGTAIVAADGTFATVLAQPQANGEQLQATQVDAAGNASLPTLATAPDITAPTAPTLVISLDGTAANGTGEPGDTVTVRNPDGSTIGTAVVAADGSYTLALDPARVDGEVLSAIQNDPTGNVSPPVTAAAPDFDAPVGLTADVSDNGTTVTGAGEAGATVTIRDPAGLAIGTAVVGADGTYVATLTTAQVNGEVLSATQVDPDGNAGLPVATTAPDLTAPAAPTADVNDTGTAVTGTGEAGATVTVTAPGGAIVATAIVGADGTYTATLSAPQANGETLSVAQADPTGNLSPAATALAPDITAPIAPTIAINANGTVISGTGEAGATVTITGADGTTVGTVLVTGDGTYTITLADPQNNGQALTATQADPAGNVSNPAFATAPDLVAPLAPTAVVSGDGTIVTGTGEPGAHIVVTDPAGAVIGAATIGADGTYSATLGTAQSNGEVLSATQTDNGGNASPSATAIAPDLTAPAIPTLTIAGDGASATGTGEPGATVTLVGPGGAAIGQTVVAPDGTYTVALNPARLNGEAFTATQADAAGNVSPQVSAAAPDHTAPAAPAAVLGADGTSVTGTGEAGATVSVTGPNGLLGTAIVAADGSFTVPLSSTQANGQPLTVIQTDPAGNGSSPTGIIAPDTTAPTAPTAIVAANGASVTGIGEPGALVTITAPGGGILGSATVAAGGGYTVTLSTAQTNGELLTASQADPAGNASPTTPALAPDTTAPTAPTAAVSADGGFVTGTGEPGATVTVTGPGGALGTAIVGVDGHYAVPLSVAQTDSQALTVRQADAAGNVSPPATAIAPDDTAPFSPTATVSADGGAVVGNGVPGATITVSGAGAVLGTAIVGADGTYTAPLDIAQRNGEVLSVVQSDAVGNASQPVPAVAPDLTAPVMPSIAIGGGGDVVTGNGESGARVTITGQGGVILGTAIVSGGGTYLVTLDTPQRNGETLVATQSDAAGNVSNPASAVAPDLTAPSAPAALVVAGDGTSVTGTGEPGARVEVRTSGGALLGTGVVGADASFVIPLSAAQVTGVTLVVTQADAAGNISAPGNVVAPFDIAAFDNTNTASIDLVPPTTAVNLGTANYVALASLGVVNLQAQVLGVPAVQFTVDGGHSLNAVFTYDALLNVGAASGYAVVVQRFDGTNWVAVAGPGNVSLLEVGLLNGNLSATDTLGPGEYRAFLTFDGAAGVGLLGHLNVGGVDSNFTAIGGAVPTAASGNVITDPGAGGAVDVVGPGTHVDSVTINGVTIAVTANGTVVDGTYGTLVINLNGSYTYTPDATPLAIGHTDAFTYTLVDPTDGEHESAILSIAIGSPDITGAPVAVADVAVAAVTYDNVVTTTAPATAFSFNSSGPLGLASTGAGAGGFTVAANSVADISITAARAPGLSVLPSYTLVVRNDAGQVVDRETHLAVVGLPAGTGTVFTVEDLPAGHYSYTLSSSAAAGSFATTVSVGATTTFLDQFTLASAGTAAGNLLENDTANTSFAGIRVNAGTGFAEIGDTAVVLTGQHGTLTVNETGDYLYRPSSTLGYSAVDLHDTFTYQVIQPNGTVATSTLTVTIDVPADNAHAVMSFASHETTADTSHVAVATDVIALDAFVAPAVDTDASVAAAHDSNALGRAIYDVFEGQGELENVLANYLPPEQHTALEGIGDAGHPTFVADVAMPAVADPLDYIVAPEDPDRHGTHTNPVY